MKQLRLLFCTVFATGLLAIGACDRDQSSGWVNGIYRDYRGLDGCGFLIELDRANDSVPSRFLEPINPGSFGVPVSDGLKIRVKYRLLRSASVCMKGQVAEITDIRKR
jgi:hypothetical protein